MVREEVHMLQSRVDVLEQVRQGWMWVMSTDCSFWGCASQPWDREFGGLKML